jgi:hypothetical protein
MLGVANSRSKDLVTCVSQKLPVYAYYFLGIITCCSHGIGSQNVKKRGRDPVRALTVIAKRIKVGKQQLDIQFSKHGGPVGDNYRSFVEEVVIYTRKRAPIIGVK